MCELAEVAPAQEFVSCLYQGYSTVYTYYSIPFSLGGLQVAKSGLSNLGLGFIPASENRI